MYSFDHDLGSFVSIGPATVSEDGTVVTSDPGVGVVKGGWHCGGNPAGTGTCTDVKICDDQNDCTEDSLCLGGSCPPDGCSHDPVSNGMACRGGVKRVQLTCPVLTPFVSGDSVNLEIDDSCQGVCQQGQCTNAPFNTTEIANAAIQAINKICHDPCIMSSSLRTTMADCLKRKGFEISCSPTPPSPSTCARAPVPNGCSLISGLFCANEAKLFPSSITAGGCGGVLAGTILHEMVHATACDPGEDGHSSLQTFSLHDVPYGCEESCFPGSTGEPGLPGTVRGNSAACE
jgi:hypothetical protein